MARQPGKHIRPDAIRSADLPPTRGGRVCLAALLSESKSHDQWNASVQEDESIIVVDLFCGSGGMSLGFENAGMFVAAGLDSDPIACETHAGNFLSKTLCLDLTTASPESVLEQLELPRIDVIIGGPPCQGFSVLGRGRVKSLTDEQQANVLAKNDLYQRFFQFIEVMQPLMFVMENVPNLEKFEEGRYYRSVKTECDRLGYERYEKILSASDYGVPQIRRRLFIVGSRIGRGFLWPQPIHSSQVTTLREAIGELPAVYPPQLQERLRYQPVSTSEYALLMRNRVQIEDRDYVYDHVVRPVRDDDREIFSHMQPGDDYIDIRSPYQRYDPKTFHDRYHMLEPDKPSISVTAHLAKDGYRYIHWDSAQHRTLSVREAARIQSFGDHFRFAGHRSSRYRQVGNAVPPLLAQAIGHEVRRTILRYREGNGGGMWQLGLPGFEQNTELVRTTTE